MDQDKILTEKESLSIINEMIHQTREYFQKGAANISLFWGYYIAVIAIANFILLQLPDIARHSFWVWLLTIPGPFISLLIRKRTSSLVKTHINVIINKIWISFGISTAVFIGMLYLSVAAIHIQSLPVVITPVILIMLGMAHYATAAACKFKLYIYSALVFWTGALGCAATLFMGRFYYNFIILAICMIGGMVIPGHILNSKAEKNV